MIIAQMLSSKNILNSAKATKNDVPIASEKSISLALMFPSETSSTSFINACAEGSEHTTAPPITKAMGIAIQLKERQAIPFPKASAIGINAVLVPKKKRHNPMYEYIKPIIILLNASGGRCNIQN